MRVQSFVFSHRTEKKARASMACHLPRRGHGLLRAFLLTALLAVVGAPVAADQPASPEALWKKLEPFARPPEEFAGKLGPYRSPLKFADGPFAKSATDWARRREEILKTWHKRLGPW